MLIEFDFIKNQLFQSSAPKPPFTAVVKKNQLIDILGEADLYFWEKSNDIENGNFENLEGRFVFVEHDKQRQDLRVWTDSIGFRKAYVKIDNDRILITSDPYQMRSFSKSFTQQGLSLFMLLGYVPPPLCLYEGWTAVPPGSVATIHLRQKELKISRWWKIKQDFKPTDYTPAIFREIFEEQLNKLALTDNVVKPAILLSGGMDSRMMAYALTIPEKKSFTLKMTGFKPEEEDVSRIATYPKSLKGAINIFAMNLDMPEIMEAFRTAVSAGSDNAHVGAWKFFFLMDKIRGNGNEYLLLSGNAADTLLSFNIPGNSLKQRLRRCVVSELAVSLFRMPKLTRPLLALSQNIVNQTQRQSIAGILRSFDESTYFLGYILNGLYPGFSEQQETFLASVIGKKNLCAAISWLKVNLWGNLKDTYGDNYRFLLKDYLLRTSQWGLEMRVFEDASVYYQQRLRYPFLTRKIINYLANMPIKVARPWGEYKEFFRDVMTREYHDQLGHITGSLDSNLPYFTNLENRILSGAIGHYFEELSKEKNFKLFLMEMREVYSLSLMEMRFENIKERVRQRPEEYTIIYRTLCAYIWWSEFSK